VFWCGFLSNRKLVPVTISLLCSATGLTWQDIYFNQIRHLQAMVLLANLPFDEF
jgi:hypothetical protein